LGRLLKMFEQPRRSGAGRRLMPGLAGTAFIAAHVARDTPHDVLSGDPSTAMAWDGTQ
jgi:hypothetical protein